MDADEDRLQADSAEAMSTVGDEAVWPSRRITAAINVRPVAVGEGWAAPPEAARDDAALVALPLCWSGLGELYRLSGNAGDDAT